ncbi:hypothetical protein K432DRAFT_387587 [Lepidopterella palustris CBS 459.81]|uniref:Uncharacterized protein n=1 Tax=Lepidopterella palustris CBS 459.81 TaxID=1314670 RepID=A0A8E2J8S5_9PEZI|nr:hypothetical protein K432DRAFT_387587 [Lepidopterella palustris CBS 459.81]
MVIFASAPPPPPVPSPPPSTTAFKITVGDHYRFFGPALWLGNDVHANNSSDPRDWQLSLHATFLSGVCAQFSLKDFPAHFLPFFAYKDAAVYTPRSGGSPSGFALFKTIYREWYPTRDRTVFDDGMFDSCGAPFFGIKMRIKFEDPFPQKPALLKHLVCWHVALSRQVHDLLPRFIFLDDVARELVRPGTTLAQLPAKRFPRSLVEYTPTLQRTFAECFLWVDAGLEENSVILVVLGEDMLRRILSGECEGLTRDVDLEEQVKNDATLGAEDDRREEKLDEHRGVDAEASMDHISVWRGSMVDVMRAVLAGDETRRNGLREYNPKLREWLGEGVNVGK